ncbi:MAG: SRPBCC family protein [Chloroflexota bacterium]
MAINISRLSLDAPLEKVWDALTKPEYVKIWQYGSDLITDWSVGGEIRFIAEWNGVVFEQWGKVIENIPKKLIRYSLFAPMPGLEDKPENYFIMSYELEEVEGAVRLSIIQEDDRPGAEQEEAQGEENPVLKALKELVEEGR